MLLRLPATAIFAMILLAVASMATAADTVASSKACYMFRETFAVSFTDGSPRSGDVIDIVAAGTTRGVMSRPTCSSFFCFFNPPRSGTVFFQERLSAGNYQAVLRRGLSSSFSEGSSSSSSNILAKSKVFRLLASGQSCTPIVTPSPTLRPTLAPSPPPLVTVNDVANQALTKARAAIVSLVQANSRLTPEFLRMGFHDCIGGCDGCIDLTNPDNNGLAHPISVLEPIVAQFANPSVGVSRADIWALAVMVGADVAPHGTLSQPVNFTMNWFGRVNCEDANTVCKDAQGVARPCSSTVGPAHTMAATTFDGPTLFSYFANNFGFTQRQVVALMGVHTVGRLVKNESGINGPNGWDFNNGILQNEYYNALIGGATSNTPLSQYESLSPNWVTVAESNAGSTLPTVNHWILPASTPIVMLNPDIALVRDLNPANTDPNTGFVNCSYNTATAQPGIPVCNVSVTASIAAQFSDSNDLWLNEFKSVLDLMLTNGYIRNSCTNPPCQLSPK